MQRSQMVKLILVLALVVFALYSLYPTFQLGGLQDRENKLISELRELTDLNRATISAGVTQGDLEATARNAASEENEARAVELASRLINLNKKISDIEENAIRCGLDLQ